MATLLILSVGTLVGCNILDAAEDLRPGLRVVGINSLAEAPNNFRCDQAWLAPPAREAEAYWRCVETVLEQERPDLVLPGRDEDVLLMARWRERHPRWARCLTVGTPALAATMVDKLAAHDWALARGLPFVATVASEDPGAHSTCEAWLATPGASLIAKPRSGSGSRGVRVLLDHDALIDALAEPGLVLQPHLADAAAYRALATQVETGWPLFWAPRLHQGEASILIGPDGIVHSRFEMQTSAVAGRCERASALDDPEIKRIGQRYAQAFAEAGWRGLASVQLLRHPQWGWQAIEFNAPSGGMVPRLLLGHDELGGLLSAWTGRSFERPPQLPAGAVLRVTRDVGVDDSAARALRETGTWPCC